MTVVMKKILAIRNDRFGEFLLNIPALRAIKETYPAAKLHVMVAPAVAELAGAVPFIDKILVRPFGRRGWNEDIALVGQLRREHYDAAIVLNPTREAHHIVFWAGIPCRIGYARKHHFLLNRTLPDKKHLGLRHEVDNNLELVGLIGAATQDRSLGLVIPDEVQAAVAGKFGVPSGSVAVHPWTSDPVKQWPLERFTELVRRLAEKEAGKVIIIGRPESWQISAPSHLGGDLDVPSPRWGGVGEGGRNILDLTGRTTLLEAAAILKQCRCLVSCDSGPMHLACSVGTRTVALFRNDMPGKNPDRWGPWGDAAGHVVVQGAGMEQITLEAVLQMI